MPYDYYGESPQIVLSVIVPAYNEEHTIAEVIKRVCNVSVSKEVIVVDDGSTDKTGQILQQITRNYNITIVAHDGNFGKCKAIRTGLSYASGDIVIIQDADLEYNPRDYSALITPIITGETNVVYGSRNLVNNPSGKRVYKWGGMFLSWLANVLYNTNITDEATCYKVFRRATLAKLNLKSEQFDFCAEVTAKLGKRKEKIIEVPIQYQPRDNAHGKKIRAIDGLRAIWILITYRFRRDV